MGQETGEQVKPSKLPFYNFNKIYSYNATYNFILGGRGIGKTFGAKEKVVKDAIKNGNQFILLRRWKTELKTKDGFMADLKARGKFPEWDFRVNSSQLEFAHMATRDDTKRTWKVAGYFVALSTAQSLKGMSFPLVKTIIFDEFIIEKGSVQYLPNEANAMKNFYSTVDRWEDRVKVFFLANSVSINNPYFIEYDIEPVPDKEFLSYMDGFIVCHFPDSEEFKNEVFKTKFGRFIQNTEYSDYAVGNGFKDNNQNLIEFKGSEALYAFSLETKKGTASIWKDYDKSRYYIQERRPKTEQLFTLVPENMKEGKSLLFRNDKLMQMLRTAFKNESVYFDKPKTRNIFIEIFRG